MRSFIICALHQTLCNEIKKLKWPVHVSHIGDRRNTHSMLIGNPSGRPKCRWEDDIKMDLKETGYEGVNCINLAKDRVQWRTFMNTKMEFWFP
jgi:hypothetical protein